ncbi:hypothetical protein F3J02_05940 [Acinetobacter sp. Tr-809]|uniref:NTF2 fold immunity protein n=1 Tax=Acinetobacter sp. Tr-809 TaxID=2608324 RepID=UPI001421EF28|nr:NTF2 fold immunity protein [Acinetobacter sp. Tr-809]NIE96018.1 hypothetical protein [Acinetobacter sp. Tr-809]
MKLILRFFLLISVFFSFCHAWGYTPQKGFVPNAEIAAKIAEIILEPIYGESNIHRQKPFHVILKDGAWVVEGTLPKSYVGGSFLIKIAKEDGRVLYLEHTK